MTTDAYMSAQAQALLAQMSGADLCPATVATVDQHREQARAAFLPRAELAVARYGVSVHPVQIAGQPCLEIRPPSTVQGSPEGTVLYCYGGGYISGSAREDLIVSASLCAHANARVVAIDYPLAPEHPWPAAHEAAWAVFEAVSEEGPLALAGESAGGNLALTVMLRAPRDRVKAALLLSPWCDLTHGGDSLTFNDGRDPTLGRAQLIAAASLYAGGADTADPRISPINGAFYPDGPPVMITTGTRDILMSQCIDLARRMSAAGQDVQLSVYDGLWHVFEFYDELPEADASLKAGGAFLRAHLRS